MAKLKQKHFGITEKLERYLIKIRRVDGTSHSETIRRALEQYTLEWHMRKEEEIIVQTIDEH